MNVYGRLNALEHVYLVSLFSYFVAQMYENDWVTTGLKFTLQWRCAVLPYRFLCSPASFLYH